MARLILHAGMHKAGSSAIQRALAASTSETFIYPHLGRLPFKGQHTDALIELFSSKSSRIRERNQYIGKRSRAVEGDEATLRRAAEQAGEGTVVLSSEGAYTFLSHQDLLKFASFAAEVFSDVRIVAYIRQPAAYISSSFQQRIKSSRQSTFLLRYKNYRVFEKFDEVFGQDKVKLWPFDRKEFPNGNVVEHFFKSNLGVEAPATTPVNTSLSRPAVSAMYLLNRTIEGVMAKEVIRAHKTVRATIMNDFNHSKWPTFRLSPEVIQPLIDANAADIAWMEDRLGRPLREPLKATADDVRNEADLLNIDGKARAELEGLSDALPAQAQQLLRDALSA